MKKILIFILLSSCINSQETEKNNSYDDLVILFEDWRLFEEPDLINGVHDYSVNSFEKKKPKYDILRERLEDYRQAVSRIAQLGSQGIDLAKQSSLLQTDINLGYGETARKNAALATGVETASRNAQISASVPKRNWAGSLLNVGMSAMPLLSMRFGGSTNLSGYRPSRFSVGLYQPQQPQALPGFNTFNEAYISSNPVVPRSTGISPVNITPY